MDTTPCAQTRTQSLLPRMPVPAGVPVCAVGLSFSHVSVKTGSAWPCMALALLLKRMTCLVEGWKLSNDLISYRIVPRAGSSLQLSLHHFDPIYSVVKQPRKTNSSSTSDLTSLSRVLLSRSSSPSPSNLHRSARPLLQ